MWFHKFHSINAYSILLNILKGFQFEERFKFKTISDIIPVKEN